MSTSIYSCVLCGGPLHPGTPCIHVKATPAPKHEPVEFTPIEIPKECGAVVGIVNYRGHVIVACEWALLEYKREGDCPTLELINYRGAAAWVRFP